jgi:hypothetical protein
MAGEIEMEEELKEFEVTITQTKVLTYRVQAGNWEEAENIAYCSEDEPENVKWFEDIIDSEEI